MEKLKPDVVVNCADFPSVDDTSRWIDVVCQSSKTPYVIAGGYNLHPSLIGMSVIPGKSACFRCSELRLEEHQADAPPGVQRLKRRTRKIGSIAPTSAITASFAASEVLRLAVPSEALMPAMLNRRGEFNFLSGNIAFAAVPPHPACSCGAAAPLG